MQMIYSTVHLSQKMIYSEKLLTSLFLSWTELRGQPKNIADVLCLLMLPLDACVDTNSLTTPREHNVLSRMDFIYRWVFGQQRAPHINSYYGLELTKNGEKVSESVLFLFEAYTSFELHLTLLLDNDAIAGGLFYVIHFRNPKNILI